MVITQTTELGNVASDMEIDGERKYTPLKKLYIFSVCKQLSMKRLQGALGSG